MPRRREVPKRKITPDPKYKDKLVAKFTNCLMVDGKKSVAEGILYGAFDVIQNRFKDDPIEVPLAAIMAPSPHWNDAYRAHVRKLAPRSEWLSVEAMNKSVQTVLELTRIWVEKSR